MAYCILIEVCVWVRAVSYRQACAQNWVLPRYSAATTDDDDDDDVFCLLTLPLPPYPLLASRADRCFDVVLGARNVSMIVFLAVLM
jgi:hypothetical protein